MIFFDHLPTIALLKRTKLLDKKPLEFESRNLTTEKVEKINLELLHTDWIGILNAHNCNENFNRFHSKAQEIMNRVALLKTFRIFARCKYVEPWMTKELENASKEKQKLYRLTLQHNSMVQAVPEYRNYRNSYIKLKQKCMRDYYASKVVEYRMNTKKLWQIINQVIKKMHYLLPKY